MSTRLVAARRRKSNYSLPLSLLDLPTSRCPSSLHCLFLTGPVAPCLFHITCCVLLYCSPDIFHLYSVLFKERQRQLCSIVCTCLELAERDKQVRNEEQTELSVLLAGNGLQVICKHYPHNYYPHVIQQFYGNCVKISDSAEVFIIQYYLSTQRVHGVLEQCSSTRLVSEYPAGQNHPSAQHQ